MPDHAVAVRQCLDQLTDPATGCLKDASEVAAIGFKAVHGGRVSGVQRVTPDVLAAMEEMSLVAPAHNPPYITAMRLLAEKLPEIPLVAAFETGFHATIDDRLRYYPVPYEWAEKLHDQAVGLSRREPSLHRAADEPAARPLRPADHFVPPGRSATACVRFAGGRAWRPRWA